MGTINAINNTLTSPIVIGATTSVITGSIDPTASTSVTGVGTKFLTELSIGDGITVSGQTRTVVAIASDTALTVDWAFSDNDNDVSVDKLPTISRFRKSDGTTPLVISDEGFIRGISQPVVIRGINNAASTTGTSSNATLRIRGSGTGALDIGNISGGNVYFQVTDTADLSVEYNLQLQPNGGKVGIGVIPTNTLHVFGSSGQIRIDDGTVTADFGCSSLLGYIGTNTNHNFTIYAWNQNQVYFGNTGITFINPLNYAVDNESTDSYVITLSPALTAYKAGQQIIFKAKTANTGAASININGLGAKTIVKAVSTTLANNDILAGMYCLVVYDGTNFVLMNPRAL